MFPMWKRRIVRIGGAPVRVIYLAPHSKPFEAADDELATRRFIATKDGVSIQIDSLTLSSFADVNAFQDMVVSACHTSHRLAERSGTKIQSIGTVQLSLTSSRRGITLQANQVKVQSLLDLLGILRPIWAAWLEIDRLRAIAE